MQNKVLTFFLCSVLALSIVGCRVRPEVKNALDRNVEKVNAALEKAEAPAQSIVLDTVEMKDDIWLGDTSIRVDAGDPLPARFESDAGITIVSSTPLNLAEVVDQIAALTGMSVRIDDSLKSTLGNMTVRSDVADTDENGSASSSSSSGSSERFMTDIAYSGPLSGLLDQVSGRMGIWWRYKGKVLTFHDVETREFTIYTLPSTTSMKADVGGSSGSSGSGGGSAPSMSLSADVTFWDQIQEVVQGMLPQGSRMVASMPRGTLTVSAPPQTLRKVGRYIKELNQKLSRQVAISVKVLQISLKDSDKYGFDIGAVFQNNGLNLIYNGAYAATGGASFTGSGLGMSIIGATKGSARHWNGSRAIIEALSTVGNVSVVTSSSVTTLNNRIAPVQVTREQKYVSEMSTQQNGSGVDPTVTATTETLSTGFVMEVLPRILDHGKLLVMFTMSLSELVDMETIKVGGNSSSGSEGTTLQLPITEVRSFAQEIAMSSGETLVLSGFEKVTTEYTERGMGEAANTLLGGGVDNARERVVMVVLLTPEVLISPLSPEARIAGTGL